MKILYSMQIKRRPPRRKDDEDNAATKVASNGCHKRPHTERGAVGRPARLRAPRPAKERPSVRTMTVTRSAPA